jgi:hypothetical protein
MDDIKGFGDDNELFGRGSNIFTIIIFVFSVDAFIWRKRRIQTVW